MKKLKLTITAIALFVATMSSFATEIEPKPTKESNQAFRSEIVSLIGSEIPEYLTNGKEFTANLSLMLNNSNELIVVSTSSENTSLDNYLKSKLNYQKIDIPLAY